VESHRQNTIIHEIGPEIDPVTEVEFPCPAAGVEPTLRQSTPSALEALQMLWEKRRILYRVAAWSCAIGIFVALVIPNEYESSISIMPPDSMNTSGTMLAALASKASPELAAMAGNLLSTKGSGALFVDLFRSRTVQDRVVDRLNLQKVYWSRYKQDARKKLDSRTGVSEDRKSGVISLTVTDKSAQRARDIAQAYVEELNHLVSQVSTSSARRERIFIEQRLDGVKSDLEDAEKQFGAFASKNSTLDIKEQTKAMVESAGVLQGQLIASQSELQSLEQTYTGSNVRVRSLQARVDELKRQLQKLQGTDASLVSDAVQPDQMYPPIRKLPLLGVEWADLYRRMKIQETVYELLNQQYELARIQEAKEIPTVNIVDPANVPERKSFPPRLLIVLLLTGASVVAAAAWLIGHACLDRLDERDLRRVLTMRAATAFSHGWERCRQVPVVRWLTRSRRSSVATSE
jgi:capsule polysaccharide export protein KpsE/RkpR